MKHYEVEILDAKTKDKLCFLDKVEPNATIGEIKSMFHKSRELHLSAGDKALINLV
ncbi:Very-long-chain enoyl-CoA reductase [Larimichthys crocea]|uniref:Uncharacterized protein n=1 Tax=Larimichthys crocea TaxID=215358 RepID=A0ACD3RUR4_LARCR|nr:Very-long-chain enoyl-CoA reductase [Larimichthys crocea]